MSRYIVMTSAAAVKGKARQFGTYRNVAVVEVANGTQPAMISARARGVVRIVRHWGACSVGKTAKCQYQVALAEAGALIEELNHGQ